MAGSGVKPVGSVRTLKWSLSAALGLCLQAPALDWPHYRGPGHDGVSTDPIFAAFPPAGPPQVWHVPLEAGFSSFAVSGGRALTQVRRSVEGQDREVCVALSLTDGHELWAAAVDRADYPDGGAGTDDGPRTTPCLEAGSVYVLSSWLKLTKLNANNGEVVWQQDLLALYGGPMIAWQNAASPVLEGDRIFVNCSSPQGSLLALRKTDGSLVWRSGSDTLLTHATPIPATILGVRQLIFLTQSGLVAVAADSGDELWRHAFPFSGSTAASPVAQGDIVYCSAAYGIGAAVVRISQAGGQFVATALWTNTTLMNEWSTPVAAKGYLYGLFGRSSQANAPLKCIDLATGTEMWSQAGFGPGGLLLVDDKLLVTDARGGVILVEAYPRAYHELARFAAVTGKCWNSPAVSDGRLFARSTSEAACLNLGKTPPPTGLKLDLERLSGGRVCLRVRSTEAASIDAIRAAAIEIRATTHLLEPPANWPCPSPDLVLTNGYLEVTFEATESAGYFMTAEPR
jgi:outer membrane protein assembly factor BamB